MKRWHYFALAAVLAGGSAYAYLHRDSLGIGNLLGTAGGTEQGEEGDRSAKMNWQTVERVNERFKVELPAEAKDLQVPAYNEKGDAEPVKMLVANPDGDTTFAITWEDNPPVARATRTPDQTLRVARDGMLARTQTSLISESRGLLHGAPTLDVSARNAGGGVLNARFIYAGARLYMLIALFPSSSARRERDVTRFFDSFAPTGLS